VENAGVEKAVVEKAEVRDSRGGNAGVNRMEHQPEIILRKPQVTSLDLSLIFSLNKVCLLLFPQ